MIESQQLRPPRGALFSVLHGVRRARATGLLLLALLPLCCSAVDISKLQPQGYVSDFARVLDASSKLQIERYCAQVEQATGVEMAIVTIPSLEGDPIEETTNALFHKWGVGKRGKDEGVMLMLAIRERKTRVEVGYGLEHILTDAFSGSVLREMRPSLREGNYGQALTAGAAHIGQTVAQAKGVALERTLPRRAERRTSRGSGGGGIPWPLIVVGIVVLLGLLGRGGGRGGFGGGGGGGFLTALLLGNLLSGGSRYRGGGSGGSGWGGGGFGGGDSGGGFGGFGGGDSGGGGASGDW